jgi:hypothetical protein
LGIPKARKAGFKQPFQPVRADLDTEIGRIRAFLPHPKQKSESNHACSKTKDIVMRAAV